MEAQQDVQQPRVVVEPAGEAQGAPTPSPSKLSSATVRADLVAQIRGLAEACGAVPDICKRRAQGEADPTLGAQVADWEELRRRKEFDLLQAYPAAGLHPSTFVPTSQATPAVTDTPSAAEAAAGGSLPLPMMATGGSGHGGGMQMLPPMPPASAAAMAAAVAAAAMPHPSDHHHRQHGSGGSGGSGAGGVRQVGKVTKAAKKSGGRTFTSKYRGVHQTFPTRRWEAQFRRNGKPTSLGCFDHEEQAARAYDKMMLWCELHNAAGVKGGITNFDPSEYEGDVQHLQSCTQDELVQQLRSDGRRQAAQRMLKQKRDGAAMYHGDGSEEDDDE